MAIQIGQALGSYRVVKKLGAGGIGAVYLAEHPLIGKKVALKVIHRELAGNAEVVQRFVNEARAVNLIGNEHILDIADIGQTEGGDHFLVMEHLHGQSLADLLRRARKLPVARALGLAAQIADGLAAAHAAGIVHRDLKPDNVFLVARPDGKDFVKLLDFGLAKLLDPGAPALTRAGVVLGTPQYMSPEQCESRAEIDARSDVYAVGVLLYQMTTGRLPFDGRSMGEILIKHVSDPPIPPRSVEPLVPAAVEQIILVCLAKRPDERFASMALLRAALLEPEAWLVAGGTGEAVGDRPETLSERKRRLAVPAGEERPPELSGTLARGSRRGRIVQAAARGRGLAVAVFALLAVGLSAAGVLLVRQLGVPAEAPPPPPSSSLPAAQPAPAAPGPALQTVPLPAPDPVRIEVQVASRPPGAHVIDDATGADLGPVPLAVAVERGQPRVVRLRLDGYAERRELLGADGGPVSVTLEPLADPVPTAPPAPARTHGKPRPGHPPATGAGNGLLEPRIP